MFWLDLLGLGGAADEARLKPAIERAVARVEPLLKQAGGYPGHFLGAISMALRYSDQLAAALPGPLDLADEHCFHAPMVRAVFATPEDVRQMLTRSQAMREYQREGTMGHYALMGMRRKEKQVFGVEIAGELLRRDVAQQSVIFSDHTLNCIAAEEADARALVAWRIFDGLIDQVAVQIATLRRNRDEFGRRRDEIMALLHGASGAHRDALQEELRLLLAQLAQTARQLELDRLSSQFDALLRTPENLVWLEQRQFRLDGMGIVRGRDEVGSSQLLSFTDLIGQDRRRWSVTMVKLPHWSLPSLSERLQAANRWLAI